MADVTINVQLQQDGNSWVVAYPNGGNVTMTYGETDTICFVLVHSPAGAEITAVRFGPGQPGSVPWPGTPLSAKGGWCTTETDTVPQGSSPVSWGYHVTVMYNGGTYVSDPEIINEPEP
jgi:hypothetical protein